MKEALQNFLIQEVTDLKNENMRTMTKNLLLEKAGMLNGYFTLAIALKLEIEVDEGLGLLDLISITEEIYRTEWEQRK